jgi:predicted RNase H-like nuclease
MVNIFLGIDGCKAGWAVVEITFTSNLESWEFYIFPTIKTLFEKYSEPNSNSDYNFEPPKTIFNPDTGQIPNKVLIDIPIGLKESGPEERKCDKDARKFLGSKRGSSVFRSPARKTVYCNESYKEASDINFKLTGKKISKQTFHICKKIREIDEFINSIKLNFVSTAIMHESHPEVVFKSLAGTNLSYSKKTKSGFNERLSIINTFNSSIEFFLDGIYKNFRKYEVQPDDIMDASVLAIVAKNIYLTGKTRKLPEEPELDSRGLRMEIVFL